MKNSIEDAWFMVPISVAENMDLFNKSELNFLLMVLAGDGLRKPVRISNKLWETTTGLRPSQKGKAVQVLRGTCLDIEGRGTHQTYQFSQDKWKIERNKMRTAR